MEFITTIGVAITAVLGFYIFLKGKDNVYKLVEKFILEAEGEYRGIRKMGEQKLIYVITKTKACLPIFFRELITDKMIKDMVCAILDTLEAYAKYQLDKIECKDENVEVKELEDKK